MNYKLFNILRWHSSFSKLLAILLFVSYPVLGQLHQFEPVSYDAGKARVFQVMYKGVGGIAQSMRKMNFAEIKNVVADVNIAAISQRFDCQTQMGQALIEYYLQHPMSCKDSNNTIAYRQAMIRKLLENPELLEQFEQLIAQAVEQEVEVMKFMAKRFVLSDTEFQDNPIVFIQRWMGSSTIWQSLTLWWSITSVYKGLKDGGGYVWDGFTTGYKAAADFEDSFYHVPQLSVQDRTKALLAGAWSTATSLGYNTGGMLLNIGEVSDSSAVRMGKLMNVAFSMKSLYDHYTQAVEKRDALYALNQLIDIGNQIEELCLQQHVEHEFKISSIRSYSGMQLIEDLQHERYTDKSSALFFTPAVHTFIYEVYKNDNYLAPVYLTIAEIDAYVAIAKKIKTLQNTDHQICFAQFLDNPTPKIDTKNFWNMLVSHGKIVVNDLVETKNIILTGSNEGGKTTAIRAILQNIILAQTFGIAAASQFQLTQFDVIHSYLQVSDDILQGKSRFAVELQQAQNILVRIKSLQSDEKFFFAFDELFTGTNGEDGAQCAYQFIDNIASFSGIQFIYATHFNMLKTIGANNPRCVNYKINPPLQDARGAFIRDAHGQLIYPYTLSRGANEVNVAMDRARDAGIFTK